jgi:hypothetical protein
MVRVNNVRTVRVEDSLSVRSRASWGAVFAGALGADETARRAEEDNQKQQAEVEAVTRVTR